MSTFVGMRILEALATLLKLPRTSVVRLIISSARLAPLPFFSRPVVLLEKSDIKIVFGFHFCLVLRTGLKDTTFHVRSLQV